MNKLLCIFVFGFFWISVKTEVICPTIDHEDSVYLPHEHECGKFYECHSGDPVLFECPEGTYFDIRLHVCNWNVDCGSLATSTPGPKTTATAAAEEEKGGNENRK